MSKKTRLRDCPAAGRPIEAFECAKGRHETFACPETCRHNPFSAANYEAYGPIEGGADTKFFNWLIEHTPNAAEFDKMISRTLGGSPNAMYFHTLAWHSMYRKNGDGETCLGQWAKQGFPGLSKDEQLVARARMQMRPAIVEIQQVLDDRRVQVVDLLDPKRTPFLLVDRVLARNAVRFAVYSVHAFRLPHFDRLFGAALMIPPLSPLAPEEIVTELIRHLGGGTEEHARREWLKEHYPRFDEGMLAVGLARRKAMFANLDQQFGKAVYELVRPFEECRDRLRSTPEIQEDPLDPSEEAEGFIEGRVWFARVGDPELELVGQGATLGRILLGRTHWRLDTMGGARLDRLRQRFELLMAERVRFAGERRDDVIAQMAAKDQPYDASLVPPALLRDPQQIATAVARVPAPPKRESREEFLARQQLEQARNYLDNTIPALNGRTPRQAASDPALRQELIRLMKERVREFDQRNLETGRSDDINWMLRELGLNEILFPPPPPRPRLKRDDDFSDFEDDYPEDAWMDLPAPPALPNRPWTTAEAEERFGSAFRSFQGMSEAVTYLEEIGYPLFQDLREVVHEEMLTDLEFELLVPIASLVVVCFAPRGTRPPQILYEDLRDAFVRETSSLAQCADEKKGMHHWLAQSAQPELLALFASFFFKLYDNTRGKEKPRENSKLLFIIILRILIDQCDRASRIGGGEA